MPAECLHAGAWLPPRDLPQSNMGAKAPTGGQAPSGTPGQGEPRATLAGERLKVYAPVGVPEPDGGIISAAGERTSIGCKGQALDVVGEPARPEQGAALQVPQ